MIDDEELEELNYKADTIEDISSQIIDEFDITETWNNEDWNEYKEIMKENLKNMKLNQQKQLYSKLTLKS